MRINLLGVKNSEMKCIMSTFARLGYQTFLKTSVRGVELYIEKETGRDDRTLF